MISSSQCSQACAPLFRYPWAGVDQQLVIETCCHQSKYDLTRLARLAPDVDLSNGGLGRKSVANRVASDRAASIICDLSQRWSKLPLTTLSIHLSKPKHVKSLKSKMHPIACDLITSRIRIGSRDQAGLGAPRSASLSAGAHSGSPA